MQANSPNSTGGAGYGRDALPLADLTEGGEPAFVIEDGAVLLKGSVSRSSGSLAFPAREVCMDTGARDMEPMVFGPRGILYSFSVIHVSASREVPYTLGYVDFENGVRVLAHVKADDVSSLYCDQPVETRAHGDQWFVVPVPAAGEE